MKILFSIILILLTLSVYSQKNKKDIRKANKSYLSKDYDKAQKLYENALKDDNTSYKALYNLGNTYFKQEKYKQALEKYQEALRYTEKNELKSKTLYNIGNIHLHNKDYKKAKDSYKEALKLNDKDKELRYNYSYALEHLKNEENQDKKNKQDNENQDKKDKDKEQESNKNDKGDEQKKDGEGDKDDKKDKEGEQKEDENNQKNEDNNNGEGKNKPQDSKKSPQEQQKQQQMMNILDALEKKEENVQEKVNLKKGKTVRKRKKEKDW